MLINASTTQPHELTVEQRLNLVAISVFDRRRNGWGQLAQPHPQSRYKRRHLGANGQDATSVHSGQRPSWAGSTGGRSSAALSVVLAAMRLRGCCLAGLFSCRV